MTRSSSPELEPARRVWRRSGGIEVATELVVGAKFYPAEAYHQKWYLRRKTELFALLERQFADEPALLRSTEAARFNGYAAGCGHPTELLERLRRAG